MTVQLRIRVDKTAPVVTGGSPSRAADVNGWYKRPVGIRVSGSDRTSGIAACTNTTYGGPDTRLASVTGICVDNAGNVSPGLGYGLEYDATPVRGARYYNVQLFHDGRKILTAWPRVPRYQLKRRWTYRGKVRRLARGKYRWLVWPGFGPRSRADYGRRIGPSTFMVRRPRAALR